MILDTPDNINGNQKHNMINTDSTQAKNLQDDAQKQQIGGYVNSNYVGASGQFNLPAGNQNLLLQLQWRNQMQ